MKNKEIDFERLIKFKSDIIRKSSNELIKDINTEKKCKEILSSSLVIFIEEMPFFLIDDDITKKILDIASKYRYDTKDKILFELINEVILFINRLNLISEEEKKYIISNYIKTHSKARHLIFDDLLDFKNTVCRDYDVFVAMKKGNISNITDTDFIGSTNYFLLVAPYIYEDKMKYEITIERANEIKKSRMKIKKNSNASKILNYLKK